MYLCVVWCSQPFTFHIFGAEEERVWCLTFMTRSRTCCGPIQLQCSGLHEQDKTGLGAGDEHLSYHQIDASPTELSSLPVLANVCVIIARTKDIYLF